MDLGLGLTKFVPGVLYSGAIIILFLTLFYKIEVGIFFLVPLLPLQNILDRFQAFPLGKDIVDIFIIAMLLKWLLNSGKYDKAWQRTPLNLPIVLLVLWTFLELWRGSLYLGFSSPINLTDSRFVGWKNFMMLPLLYLIVVNNIRDDRQIRQLVVLMILSMLYMDYHYYSNSKWLDRSHFSFDIRGSGTFSYLGPNELAIFFAQYTMIAISLFRLDTNKWRKILFGATMLLNLYPLMYLYSRGGYFAAAAGVFLLGLLLDRKILILLFLFALSWTSIVPVSVKERVEMTKDEEGYDSTVRQREGMIEDGLRLFKQNPLLGNGYDSIAFLNLTDHITGQKRPNLHNAYVQVLAELGIVGMAIYLYLFLSSAWAGWRLFRDSSDGFRKGLGLGLVASVLAMLVGNATSYCWQYLNVAGYYWVFTALAVRSHHIYLDGVKNHDRASPNRSKRLHIGFGRCANPE